MTAFSVCMTVTGILFLVMLRAFFIRHPIRTIRETARALRMGGRRPLMALLLAMAGTLGVGNLTGVALGIMIGGAGSVFWIWVSSVFACVLKYAEGVLAVDMRSAEGGGMMWVMRRAFRGGRSLSCLYAAVCLVVALSMGAALQSRAAAEAAEAAYSLMPTAVALGIAAVLCCVILGGVSLIERTVAVTVPLAAGCYILLCGAVLLLGWRDIPAALGAILRGAFTAPGAVGGVLGCLTSRAVQQGFAGGLLSNEAGAGTSTLAHARNTSATAVGEGLLGMCEVVFDTFLCTLTGLCLVLMGGDIPRVGEISPMGWLSRTFADALGAWSGGALFFAVLAFAFSTIVCWYYYGQSCARYLFGNRIVLPYAVLFVAAVGAGGVLPSHIAVYITDMGLCVLSFMTLAALLKSSDRLRILHRAVFRPREQTKEACLREP